MICCIIAVVVGGAAAVKLAKKAITAMRKDQSVKDESTVTEKGGSTTKVLSKFGGAKTDTGQEEQEQITPEQAEQQTLSSPEKELSHEQETTLTTALNHK